MSFSLSIGKWAKNQREGVSRFHKAVILELFSSVVQDTPVLEGRLAGDWQISKGAPITTALDKPDPDKSATIAKIEDGVRDLNVLKDYQVFLANNMPYANRIEFDGWSHTKAPQGMVRINLSRVQANLDQIFTTS